MGEISWLQTFASDFALPADDTLELPDGSCLATRVEHFDHEGAGAPPNPFSPNAAGIIRTDPGDLCDCSQARPLEKAPGEAIAR